MENNLPLGWDFAELQELVSFIDYRGKTPTKTVSGIPLITAKNVKKGFINDEPREFIAPSDYESWMTRGIPRKGDILFTTEAPLGNVAQLNTESRIALAQRIIALQPFKDIEASYIKYALLSGNVQKELFSNATGTTVAGI